MIKNLRKNAIILLFVSFIVLFCVLKDDFRSIIDNLLMINPWWGIVALISSLLYIFFKALVLFDTVKEEIKNYTLLDAVKHTLKTQFFNGITPFSSGGQPMEIYMIHKRGIRIPKATNLIMQNFIFYQVALVLFGILAVIINGIFHYFKEVKLLKYFVVLGFCVNTFVLLFLFIVSFSKKSNEYLLKKAITFFNKIKIVKDKEKTLEKWKDRLEDFHESASQLRKNKRLFIKGVSYNFFALIFLYVVPLFVIYSIVGMNVDISIVEAIISSAYVLIIGSFVPIPGASGGIEYGFIAFFGNFIKGAVLSATLLLWRFITYYLPMILGAICFSLDKGEKEI